MVEAKRDRLPTVLVADDHPAFQIILERLMAGIVEVLPSVTSLSQLAKVLSSRPLPDLLLLDLVFGDEYAIPRLRKMRRAYPNFRIIAYTGFNDPRICAQVMEAGANGYLVKPEPLEVVKEALLSVLDGNIWVSECVMPIPGEQFGIPEKELTHTQRLIILLRAQGLRNKEVADIMGISTKGVESHVTKIRKKLRSWPVIPYLGDLSRHNYE